MGLTSMKTLTVDDFKRKFKLFISVDIASSFFKSRNLV